MKYKNPILVLAGLFAMLFVMSFTSAAVTSVSSATLNSYDGSFQVTVTTNTPTTVSLSTGTLQDSTGKKVTFSNLPSGISVNGTKTFAIDYSVPEDFNLNQENLQTALTANNGEANATISFSEPNFCQSTGNQGGLDITIKNVNVDSGYGQDSDWLPFDKVNFDVKVENNGNENVRSIDVEYGLWDNNNNAWAIEPNTIKSLSLNKEKTQTFTESLTLDKKAFDESLSDLEDGTYTLYARAIGEIDNSSRTSTCAMDDLNVNMIIENDFVIVPSSDLTYSSPVQCGTDVQFSGTAWNIGSDDQNSVSIRVMNSQLGLDKTISVGDINSMDNADFTFDLPLNDNVTAGTYFLKFIAIDKDGNVFQDNYNNDESVLSVPLVVTGDCSVPDVAISASLLNAENGVAGKPLTVKATIVNSGTKSATYTLNVAGYSPWADSAQIDQPLVTINAGESKDVLVTLNLATSALGDETFNLEVLSNGKLVANQPVSVSVDKSSGLTSIFGDNWHIWAIGLLNLILVIVIIIIAVRIARKK